MKTVPKIHGKIRILLLLGFAQLQLIIQAAAQQWEYTSGPNKGSVISLAIHPNGSILAGTSNGISRSIDNGFKWLTTTGLENHLVYSLVIQSASLVLAGTDNGLYMSRDSGSTWIRAQNNGLTSLFVQTLALKNVDTLFAGTRQGIFRSTNIGDSWDMIDTARTMANISILSIVVKPNTNTLFVGTVGNGLYQSTNNGFAWKQVNPITFGSLSVNSVIILPGFDSLIVATNKGGFSTSTVGVIGFQLGLPVENIFSFATTSRGIIFAGIETRGVYSSIDGVYWFPDNFPSGMTVRSLALKGDSLLFAGTSIGRVFGRCRREFPDVSPIMLSTESQKHKMFSVPYTLSSPMISDAFHDLMPYDPMIWRFFGNWSDVGGYTEFTRGPLEKIEPRRGYWVITRKNEQINLQSGTPPCTDLPATLVLNPGWNMVGNPFSYTVRWDTAYKELGIEQVIWKPNSAGNGYEPMTDILEPFQGYFVKNNNTSTSIANIPQSRVQSLRKASNNIVNAIIKSGCGIQIKIWTTQAKDEFNFAGCQAGASRTWDAYDFSEPPIPPGDFLSFAFDHFDWSEHAGRYAGDFRPLTQEGEYWDGELRTNLERPVISVQLEPYGEMPNGFQIYLADKGREQVLRIDDFNTYHIQFEGGERAKQLRFIIGRSDFIRQHTWGIPSTPIEYSLSQNYPNPFNPETFISYSLRRSGFVELAIHNLLGQKVRTLVNKEQQSGHYSIRWDGSTDDGGLVASGVYFYTIRSEPFVQTRKMILVR